MARPLRPLLALLVVLLGSPAVLAACGDSGSVAEQAKSGDRKGYVAGDGQIVQIAPAERGAPVDLAGETLDGGRWDSAEHRGSVVVVNLWASWCGPCQEEAPELVALHEEYAPRGVEMVGIDYREPSIETGRSQAEAWGLPYPSIYDDSGATAVAMQGRLAAQPSTAVLDREGRIAAVVLGAVSRGTLGDLVDDVLAEQPGGGSASSSGTKG